MSAHVHGAAVAPFAVNAARSRTQFGRFAWLVLAYNFLVILWGAYVRVSFSGDGCGANWPFCNGQIIPRKMTVPTAIEYTHRIMTSVDSLAVIGLCVWAFQAFPKRHAVRLYSLLSLVFLLIEALLGAGLVLFRYVAKDQSVGRAWYLSAHLTNTMLLLATLTAAAWFARTDIHRFRLKTIPRLLIAGLALTVLVSVTGTIAALGDTLFPAASLASGVRQDFSGASSMLLRLRIVHPLIAVAAAAYLFWLAGSMLKRDRYSAAKKAAGAVLVITLAQVIAGMVNLSLLAPMWMQLTHLFIADLLWIALLIMTLEISAVTSAVSMHPARPPQ